MFKKRIIPFLLALALLLTITCSALAECVQGGLHHVDLDEPPISVVITGYAQIAGNALQHNRTTVSSWNCDCGRYTLTQPPQTAPAKHGMSPLAYGIHANGGHEVFERCNQCGYKVVKYIYTCGGPPCSYPAL